MFLLVFSSSGKNLLHSNYELQRGAQKLFDHKAFENFLILA